MKAWAANNIKVIDKFTFDERRRLQDESISALTCFISLLGVAKKVFKFSTRRELYWTKLAIDAEKYLVNWRDKDIARYTAQYGG